MKKFLIVIGILFSGVAFASYFNLIQSTGIYVNSGSLVKGLVGQWDLKSADRTFGSDFSSNGGFETGDLTGWGTNPTEGTVTITSTAQEGVYASLLTRTSGSTHPNLKLYKDFTTIIGNTYKLSFWTRGDGTNAGNYSVYDVGNSLYYKGYDTTGVSGTTYTKIEYSFVANSTSARIQFTANNDANLATIYYDNFLVKELKISDLTPNGNTGTITGATFTTDRHGQANKAMNFDGTNDYVSIGNNPALNFGANNFSISYWVKTSWADANSDKGMLLNKVQSVGALEMRFGLSYGGTNKGMRLILANGTGNINLELGTGTANLNNGAWHFLTFVIDRTNNQAKLIADGTQLGTTTDISALTGSLDNTGDWQIGLWNANYFPGDIADVRIYNRVLSTTEIASLYDSYKPGSVKSGSLVKGLVGKWSLAQDSLKSATTIADLTPNGNTGTITGATFTTDRHGQANKAMNFNGSSNYIALPNAAKPTGTGPFSISVWFKSDVADTIQQIFGGLGWGSAGTQGGVSLGLYTNNGISFDIYDSDERSQTSGGIRDWTTGWHHAVAIWAGTGGGTDGQDLWVDGVKIGNSGSNDIESALDWTGSPNFNVGTRSDHSTYFFNGQIADMRIYNRVLTDAEILQIYNSYK